MTSNTQTTVTLMTGLLVGLLSAACVVWVSLAQPWLGLQFATAETGLRVTVNPNGPSAALPSHATLLSISAPGSGDPLALETLDILEEPDTLGAPHRLAAFFQRQGDLFQMLLQPRLSLRYQAPNAVPPAQTMTIDPANSRPLNDLPSLFWFQLAVGMIGLLLGAWVLLQAKSDAAGRFAFVIACLGLWLASHSAALYSSRELALSAQQFLTASRLNFVGSLLAGIGLVNLFLVCPTRIAKPWQLWIAPVILLPLGAITVFGSDGVAIPRQVSMIAALVMVLAALVFQVVLCWRDTVARIILSWLGFAVLLSALGFVFAIVLPALNGQEQKIAQGHAMAFVLVIYIALSVAVARYRLYDLPDVSLRMLFYVGGLVPLLLVDAALVYFLSFEAAPALGVSLAFVGLFYLPLRSQLARIFNRSPERSQEELFTHINEVVLSTDHISRRDAFETLVQWLFQPLQIRSAPKPVSHARLIGNGEAMDLPGPVGLGDLRLSWAKNGRGLFTQRDLRQATTILETLEDLLARHEKYDTAISQERSRINRDVHDNIGILLSSALHSNDIERKDVLIRQTLKDMREIIVNPVQDAKPLLDLVADLRGEVSELFEAAEITLNWQDDGLPRTMLASAQVQTLRALCREAANNILKHANAKHAHFELQMRASTLSIEIEDDGVGIDTGITLGSGIENLRNRVLGQGGSFVISSSEDSGTRIKALIETAIAHENVQTDAPVRTSA